MTAHISLADPTSPQSLHALRAYYSELAAVFPGGFDPGPIPGDGLDQMRPPLGLFLLAWAGDNPIGCVALRGEGTPTAEVKRLWVAPAARGTGLAASLMAEVEERARQMAITRLVLDTSRHLPAAIAFYRRHGWTEIARYNDNPYAHHFFEKPLTAPTAT